METMKTDSGTLHYIYLIEGIFYKFENFFFKLEGFQK